LEQISQVTGVLSSIGMASEILGP